MAATRHNRELKAYCDDFRPIRGVLKGIGATFIERKDQVDYFFNLPEAHDASGTKRLKLRIENQNRQLIYYYDRRASGSRSVEFQLLEVSDPQIKSIFETALGVKLVVKKHREVWRKDNTIFNLDRVDGVGKIFEVEVEVGRDDPQNHQIAYYKGIFEPHVSEEIVGSNEDILSGQSDPDQ